MKSDYLTNVSFKSLPLDGRLSTALEAAGFSHCTEIQQLSLPLLLAGKDIAAQSQTGTGKTAAFLLGMFQHLINHPQNVTDSAGIRALILAPTRELAIQIHKDALQLGINTDFNIALAYGGTDYEKQRRALQQGADVLIGTPGRIIDYFRQRVFSLKSAQVVILDEADRMFDLGFISDIRYLLRRMPNPENRLSLLFSATLSHRVMELAYEHMNNPIDLKTKSDTIAADKVEQQIYHPASDEKIPLLIGLMQKLNPCRSIVFVNTKRAADAVHGSLLGNNINADVLSGDVRQKKRQRLIRELAEGSLGTLIATDVAARGLHIEGITHVFNFDLPQNPEDYVHRIGRTARAGADGKAISFACEEYVFSLPEIEILLGHEIQAEPITDDIIATPAPPKRLQRKKTQEKNNGNRRRRHGPPRRRKPSGKSEDTTASNNRS